MDPVVLTFFAVVLILFGYLFGYGLGRDGGWGCAILTLFLLVGVLMFEGPTQRSTWPLYVGVAVGLAWGAEKYRRDHNLPAF